MQLRSSDGQLFELSDAAARQSITLQGAEDVNDGAPVPVPLLDSGRLQRITTLLEQTALAFGLGGMTDEARDVLLKNGLPRGDMGAQLRAATAAVLEGVDRVADLATLLSDLKWFDAPLLMSVLAEGVARLLSGMPVDVLRMLLEANDDLGDQEKEAALREPLFTPPAAAPDGDAATPAAVPAAAAPPPLARSVSLAMDGGADDEGNMMACLKRCDAQTLRQLKAVSAGWQQRARRALLYQIDAARRELRDRLDAEELDVEELSHLGLLHEAVAAVSSMPNLARLRGYGFRVELKGPQGVEQAALHRVKGHFSLRKALRGCIHEGEGEPPRELLLAAVACAAPGEVRGVPVQQLREDDAISSLNLDGKGLGFIGAELLGLMLPAATSLRKLSLARNSLVGETCIKKSKVQGSSFEVGAKVTYDGREMTVSQAPDSDGDIKMIDLSGFMALAASLPECGLTSLDLTDNQLCGLDIYGRGTYTTEGITKLCEALKGSAVTSLNLIDNQLCCLGRHRGGVVARHGQARLLLGDLAASPGLTGRA